MSLVCCITDHLLCSTPRLEEELVSHMALPVQHVGDEVHVK